MAAAYGMDEGTTVQRTAEDIRLSKKERNKRKRAAKASRVKAERALKEKKRTGKGSITKSEKPKLPDGGSATRAERVGGKRRRRTADVATTDGAGDGVANDDGIDETNAAGVDAQEATKERKEKRRAKRAKKEAKRMAKEEADAREEAGDSGTDDVRDGMTNVGRSENKGEEEHSSAEDAKSERK